MSEANDSSNFNGEENSMLPGGVTTGYLDDLSMLSLNGHAGDETKEAPAVSFEQIFSQNCSHKY